MAGFKSVTTKYGRTILGGISLPYLVFFLFFFFLQHFHVIVTPMESFDLQTIGTVHSPFTEKFGIPRQAGLIPSVSAVIEMEPTIPLESFRGLEQFSHIWVVFLFHKNLNQGWKPMVRPPRMGGNRKLGVFSTRSGFRPNPVGMSVIRLKKIEFLKKRVNLHLRGADLMDQTPVIDIKPYIPWADNIPNARGGQFHEKDPHCVKVIFEPNCEAIIQEIETLEYSEFRETIIQILKNDPRPAYLQNQSVPKIYGFTFGRWNIRFQADLDTLHVIELKADTKTC
ncbi:tRNA (N6-threonylcarbamoyladenosine(37)-N6)-methyltransferase TrmO [Desulfobacterales bacterium HSG17]|nr:tRNA (N6-threonylcarbamoyladenosine(37)-N6)-methyltransferase TrmO [Desulfobacterales bacterium HSG17]